MVDENSALACYSVTSLCCSSITTTR